MSTARSVANYLLGISAIIGVLLIPAVFAALTAWIYLGRERPQRAGDYYITQFGTDSVEAYENTLFAMSATGAACGTSAYAILALLLWLAIFAATQLMIPADNPSPFRAVSPPPLGP